MHKLIFAIPLLLGACAAPQQTPAPTTGPAAPAKADASPLQALAQFTVTDLQNALAEAQAGNDQAGADCYSYLIPVVQQAGQQLGQNATVSGAFSAFEAGRVVATNVKGFVNGVPSDLNLHCAALVLDSAHTLVKLGAAVGLAVTLPGSGLIAPLP